MCIRDSLSAARNLQKFGDPHDADPSTGGAARRMAPPCARLWKARLRVFCRFRAVERPVWPVGRARAATSRAGL
eukprot:7780278-Alexandrium_andersonii.AAC.1